MVLGLWWWAQWMGGEICLTRLSPVPLRKKPSPCLLVATPLFSPPHFCRSGSRTSRRPRSSAWSTEVVGETSASRAAIATTSPRRGRPQTSTARPHRYARAPRVRWRAATGEMKRPVKKKQSALPRTRRRRLNGLSRALCRRRRLALLHQLSPDRFAHHTIFITLSFSH